MRFRIFAFVIIACAACMYAGGSLSSSALPFSNDTAMVVQDTGAYDTGTTFTPDTGPSRSAVRVLVMRPTSAYGADSLQNRWLLLLCEAYFHFRLIGVPGIEIVSPELLAKTLPEYKAFQKPVSQEAYFSAAQRLLAPYALYIECGYKPVASGGQITFGHEVQLIIQLTKVDNSKDIITVSKPITIRKLESTFDRFIAKMLDSLRIDPAKRNAKFLSQPLLCASARPFKELGAAIEDCLNANNASWHDCLKRYRVLLNGHPEMAAGYFAGMQICSQRNDYLWSAHFAQDLVDEFGEQFGPAFIYAVHYYRLANDCKAARQVAGQAPNEPLLREDLERELGSCAPGADIQESAPIPEFESLPDKP